MSWLVGIVKTVLLPGSSPFLILASAVGVVLLFGPKRLQRWGRAWLLMLVVVYWFLSIPLGADLIAGAIGHGYGSIASATEARGATAIVVLDGGTLRFRARDGAIDTVSRPSAFRALEGARVYRLLGDPLVFVTGGADVPQDSSSLEGGALREELVRAGVPRDRIVLDTASPNTRAHAVTLARLLRDRRVASVVLVTSATHIRRAAWTFRAAGIDVVPSAAAVHSSSAWTWRRWWPSVEALQVSEDALRDALAIVYYWTQGWLANET